MQKLADYFELPVEVLRDNGVHDARFGSDGAPCIEFPYPNPDGSVFRMRVRRGLEGDGRFAWRPGEGQLPYGLDRLRAEPDTATPILVEGESDCWTLWNAGFVAVGVPGASSWRSEWAEELRRFARVIVWREPDDGGAKLAQSVADDMPDALVHEGDRFGKDANALWKACHADLSIFKERMEEVLAGATSLAASLVIPTEENDYAASPDGITWMRQVRRGGGEVIEVGPVRLTNFTTAIEATILLDDGEETTTFVEVKAALAGTERTFVVSASRFASMNWPMEELGAGAILEPGVGSRERARAAIQHLSGSIPERHVYTHTGWRQHNGEWVYIHSGGAIGPNGAVMGIESQLPDGLSLYELPAPPAGNELGEAVRASLGLLRLGPGRVTVPVLAAVYTAPLLQGDSVHLVGPTGSFKTELAALAQQHYGRGMGARNLPGSWMSTGNSLEMQAFHLKDALFVVDDFNPIGNRSNLEGEYQKADRLLRGVGNRAGRARLSQDASLRPVKPPRAQILSTGETVPPGQSLRARQIVVTVAPDDINANLLTDTQRDAERGLYVLAMSGFLTWLAARKDDIDARVAREVVELRELLALDTSHRRTPTAVAGLAASFGVFLDFAVDVEAIGTSEAEDLRAEPRTALALVANAQAEHQIASEPTAQLLRLLRAAIAAGKAHVAARAGGPPEGAEDSGWVTRPAGDWQPQGELVGWIDGANLYLDPKASYAVAQRLALQTGVSLQVEKHALHRRLRDGNLLVATDEARGHVLVRKVIAGTRRDVLHLHAEVLYRGAPPHSAQSAHSTDAAPPRTVALPTTSNGKNGIGPLALEPGDLAPSDSPQLSLDW